MLKSESAIIEALKLTDELIKNTKDEFLLNRLLYQRTRLINSLTKTNEQEWEYE